MIRLRMMFYSNDDVLSKGAFTRDAFRRWRNRGSGFRRGGVEGGGETGFEVEAV